MGEEGGARPQDWLGERNDTWRKRAAAACVSPEEAGHARMEVRSAGCFIDVIPSNFEGVAMCCRCYRHGRCWINQYLHAEASERHRSQFVHVESDDQLCRKVAPGHLLARREATDGVVSGA